MTEARFIVDLFLLQIGDAKVLCGHRATSSLSGETVASKKDSTCRLVENVSKT